MAIRPDLLGVRWIRRLSLAALDFGRSRVQAGEVTVQLFDLSHQVGIEPTDLDARLPEAQLTSSPDRVVWIKNTDHDLGEPSLNDPLSTGELGLVANRARLESGEQRRTRQCLVGELLSRAA
jgi:hypothetical protein